MYESMPFSSSRISRDEQELLSDAINEYNDQFPLILTYDCNSFMKMIERYIQINATRKGRNISQRSLNKILTLIQKRYLEPEHSKINKLIQSSDRNNMERYLGTNYIPHCNATKTPLHSCGNTLFVLDSYLVCLDCKLIDNQVCYFIVINVMLIIIHQLIKKKELNINQQHLLNIIVILVFIMKL